MATLPLLWEALVAHRESLSDLLTKSLTKGISFFSSAALWSPLVTPRSSPPPCMLCMLGAAVHCPFSVVGPCFFRTTYPMVILSSSSVIGSFSLPMRKQGKGAEQSAVLAAPPTPAWQHREEREGGNPRQLL